MNMENPCRMNMYFHARACEKILWDSWQAYTVPSFIGSAIAIGLITFAYEGLKVLRDYLYVKNAQAERSSRLVKQNGNGSSESVSPPRRTAYEQMFNWPHFIQACLHAVQITISYSLMMIIMLCNYWLWLAIILGAASGYFVFGWIVKKGNNDGGECCY